MIQKILAKNFRSIGELDVDLTFAEGKAPNDYEKMERIPFVEEAGIRCVPIAAIFGANARPRIGYGHAIHDRAKCTQRAVPL